MKQNHIDDASFCSEYQSFEYRWHAAYFKRHVQGGMAMAHAPPAGVDYHVPFGGRWGSSYGARKQGSYATEFSTTATTACCGV